MGSAKSGEHIVSDAPEKQFGRDLLYPQPLRVEAYRFVHTARERLLE